MASGTSGYQRSKSTSSVIPHPHVGDGVTTDRPTAYQHFTWSSRWTCDHPESARCRREEPPTVIGQGAEEHRTWPPMPGAEPPPSRVYRARQRETRGGKAKRREPETQSWQGFPHVCHGHVRPLDRFPKPGALVRFQPRAPAETLTYQRFRTLRRSQSAQSPKTLIRKGFGWRPRLESNQRTRFRKPIQGPYVTVANVGKPLPGLGFGFSSFRFATPRFSLPRAIDARWRRLRSRHRRPRSVFFCALSNDGRGLLAAASGRFRMVAGPAA